MENAEVITDVPNLAQDISALYLNEEFSDIVLSVGTEKLHAHKMILGARSEYFKALLFGGLEESTQSEVTIKDVSPDVFRVLLKYIYTGTMTVEPSNINLTLEVLALAHQYVFTVLQSSLIKKLITILNLENVCPILNVANLYDMCDLREACHEFMDKNASEILQEDGFNELTQTSMIKLLQRDSFFAPEVKIFKGVAKWCVANGHVDKMVMKCVRLSWLSVVEIMSLVKPSKLVDNEDIFNAIAENVDIKSRKLHCRALRLVDENIATASHEAKVISGTNTTYLLNGNTSSNYTAYTTIGNPDGITIKLGNPSFINHIRLMLYDADTRCYSYYIVVSADQRKWKKVIDYRHCFCRSYQNLYFKQEIAQYIKVVGTHDTLNGTFQLIFFEAYYKIDIPKTMNCMVCPTINVATSVKKALVVEGTNPSVLLNGNTKNYNDRNSCTTYHAIGSGAIVVQLAQPYIISSIKLLLWDADDRFYHYYVESSLNRTDWEMIVDRRIERCMSWQICHFTERPVVYIRITGTHNSANEGIFHCVHLECPASDTK